MVKTIVVGAAGRMGNRIINAISEAKGIQLFGGTEAKGHPAIGRDIGEVNGMGRLGISISDDLGSIIKGSDVVIDLLDKKILDPRQRSHDWIGKSSFSHGFEFLNTLPFLKDTA